MSILAGGSLTSNDNEVGALASRPEHKEEKFNHTTLRLGDSYRARFAQHLGREGSIART
jgi:hypothetical protein